MKTKLIGLVSATALGWAVAAAPALAGGMLWDFHALLTSQGHPSGDIGSNSDTFTQGSQSLEAIAVSQKGTTDATSECAFNWCLSTLDLYSKDGSGASEQGLGLSGDPLGGGGEIYYPNGIFLSTTGISGHIASIELGSLQGTSTSGESWEILGANNNSTSWSWVASGMGGNTATYSGANLADYTYFIVEDPSGTLVNNSNDIVLMNVTTVPEPSALALFAAGLLGCALFINRRRRARQS